MIPQLKKPYLRYAIWTQLSVTSSYYNDLKLVDLIEELITKETDHRVLTLMAQFLRDLVIVIEDRVGLIYKDSYRHKAFEILANRLK